MDREHAKQRIIQRIHPDLYPIEHTLPQGLECIVTNKKNILGARRGFAMMEISEQSVLEAISYARLLVKKATKAKWFLNELGLYLLLVGKEEHWKPFINEIQADKTGMHSVIIQAIHCLDIESGASHLSQSKWGAFTFGETTLPAIIKLGIKDQS